MGERTVVTRQVVPGIVAIDTWMAGRQGVTSAYLLEGDEPALVETGPSTSADAVTEGLGSLGVGPEDLAHVVLTHIHLDHAGGAGTIARRFPRSTVWVHARGARHLADPTRLLDSATRVYGAERLRTLFGDVEPVPAERLRSIDEGDVLRLPSSTVDVLYTPGHASHHVALHHAATGAVFTGDALGIHLPDVGVLRPATPPPDIDVEAAVDSIERIRRRTGSVLLFSHFGPVGEVDDLCRLASSRLRTWADVVRDAMRETEDLSRIAEILTERTAAEFASAPAGADTERYHVLSGMEMNAAGLVRYWTRRADGAERERDGGSGGGRGSAAPGD